AETLGRTEPFTIETPADTLRRRLLLDQHLPHAANASLGTHDLDPIKQWPDNDYLEKRGAGDGLAGAYQADQPLKLALVDALQIAAHESREYQSTKESVFEAALQLDLQRDSFRRTWSGVLKGMFETDLKEEIVIDNEGNTDTQNVSGLEYGGSLGLSQRFKNGLTFTGLIGIDLVTLLTQNRLFSRGVWADASISIPLMRGAGEFVVTEPLTQAQREVVYAIYGFERFKREFAVRIAEGYLGVLRLKDQVQNEEENYRGLITSTRRARRLADAGRLPEIQVDQSFQDELRARNRWVAAIENYERRLDAFKMTLGLPTDAAIELDRTELETLAARVEQITPPEERRDDEDSAAAADNPIVLVAPGQGVAGPYELEEEQAILLALEERLDLRVALGRVHDAQRGVAIAADQLRADITLLGSGTAGEHRTLSSAGLEDARLEPGEGVYSALLTVDLPLERTSERNAYRGSLIKLEQAVRNLQELEDEIKLAGRNRLSELLEAREAIQIQAMAVTVAERRVDSTNLFLEAGRAEIRDVLEAQEALVSAQNALTAALVNYRVGELALQRDLGVLAVNEKGLWQEYTP
ncbi:MAG: TolC family protein, partial [Planctomycetes bacterium]|nr:TolC family protein [Planctomycetota bacterium]